MNACNLCHIKERRNGYVTPPMWGILKWLCNACCIGRKLNAIALAIWGKSEMAKQPLPYSREMKWLCNMCYATPTASRKSEMAS